MKKSQTNYPFHRKGCGVKILKIEKTILFVFFIFLAGFGQAFAEEAIAKSEYPTTSEQDSRTVSGSVVDEGGEGIPGASVVVKGTTIGTVTNIDGEFTLTNVPDNSILSISFIGMTTQEVQMVGQTVVKVVLKTEANELGEVVAVGYGTQRKESVVGAISSIRSEDLVTPSRSITNIISSKVAGITFTQSSGEPGSDAATIMIRGKNALSGSQTPLILVDGIERSMTDLDPNDIESFDVLKDASSTAVFGLQGANGVIVITTKQGVKGKPQISVNISSSLTAPTYVPEFVDAWDYVGYSNEAYLVRDPDTDPGLLYTDEDILAYKTGIDRDLYPNVNYYDELIDKLNFQHKANMNVRGGGDRIKYFMSAGFFTQEGMFKNNGISEYDLAQTYNRYNFRNNLTVDLTTTTKMTLGINGYISENEKPITSFSDIYTTIFDVPNNLQPMVSSEGDIIRNNNQIGNPYWAVNAGFKKVIQTNIQSQVKVDQDLKFITPGLKAGFIFSFDRYSSVTHSYAYAPETRSISGRDEYGNLVTAVMTDEEQFSYSNTTPSGNRKYYLQPTVSYSKTINSAHELSALAVYTQSDYMSDTNSSLTASLPDREQSVSGRLTYGYKKRYFAEVNAGYSGSQVFAEDNRWALFPAVGFGWTVSEETFFEPMKKIVSYMKLRYSDGKVGTTGGVSRFQYISTPSYPSVAYAYGDINQYSHGGATEGTIGITGLTWETVRKQNFGIDFKLFDQVMFNVDVFKDYRSDILVKRNSLPVGVLGLSSTPYGNVGEVETKGIEFHMDYRKKFNQVLVSLSGNFLYHKVNVIEDEKAAVPYSYMETEGMGLDYIYKYVSAGLFRDEEDIANSPIQSSLSPTYALAPGDIKYKDLNGDGKIDVNDKTFIGERQPRLYYSANADVEYKNFALKVTLQGKGKMLRNFGQGTRIPFNEDYYRGNIIKGDIEDRWTPAWYSGDPSTENPDAVFPRLSRTPNSNNSEGSSFWEKKAGYLKVQELSLAYTVPKDVATKLKMKSCRMYLTGQNLFTFSKFKYWDPEQTSAFAYPTQRLYSLTVELGF